MTLTDLQEPDQVPPSAASRSWTQAWAERDALLAVARSRTACLAEAEDVVSEAIVRAQEAEGVDGERVGAWLTTVAVRLCVDAARDRARHPKRIAYQLRQGVPEQDPAERVCDRAEAAWAAALVERLPPRQREALRLRAEGLDIAAVAAEMGVEYRAAEGLLQRARSQLKALLATAVSWVVAVVAVALAAGRKSGPAAAGATAAVALAVLLPLAEPQEPQPGGATQAPAAADVRPAQALAQRVVEPASAPTPTAPAPNTPRPAAPPFLAAHETAPPPSKPVVLPSRSGVSLDSGLVEIEDGGSTRVQSEESLLDSAVACVSRGPVIGTDFVGCDPEAEGRP